MSRPVGAVGGSSLAFRAREEILEAILARRFLNGRLPPEDELAEMLGVSRTTVRAALQSLEHYGVVTRTPGRGTLVREPMNPSVVALQRLIGFSRLLQEQGHQVGANVHLLKTAQPLREAVESLEIAPSTECYVIDRLMTADGKPAIWATDVFPVAIFARELSVGAAARSPFEMERDLFVDPIEHAVVELLPRTPTKEVRARLGLKQGEPYILLKERHLGATGAALGFSMIHVNDRFVRFQLIRNGESL